MDSSLKKVVSTITPPIYILLSGALVSILAIGVFIFIAVKIFISDDLFSVKNPVKDLNSIVFNLEKKDFIKRLSDNQKVYLANQVQFVSDIIRLTNKKIANNQELALAIVSESTKAQVSPLFVASIIKYESSFQQDAVSYKGAKGLMQLMPNTAIYTEAKLHKYRSDWHIPKKNLHHQEYNIALGIAYLKYLKKEFNGNHEHALIAYNWGPGNLKNALRKKSNIPTATKIYAKNIISSFKKWNQELNQNYAFNSDFLKARRKLA